MTATATPREQPTEPRRPGRPGRPAHRRRPLTWRAELGRQLRRRRTLWSFGLLLALPLVVVGAFAIGRSDGSSPTTATSFVSLATANAANFAVFTTSAAASFLLVVLAALFVGDALPSEASWSSLRYLLVAPVPRTRLLTSKLVVALTSMAFAVFLLIGWSLLVGGVFYGWGAFTNPAGGTLGWDVLGWRLLGVAAYVVVTLLQVGAIAFALGTRTDAPLAAVGGAVMVTIVTAILGQIDNLGVIRNGLPMYYQRAWFDLLAPTVDWTGIRHGVVWSLFWTVLFIGLGYALFRRKDVLS
ncbi:ABC transporter permease subunit [Lapillicoccus jejuensis]|uniref:ABC-2 type transport system permease protein n=1 Tax=Lapillicoccus jejuensis TaxID=402171 RepID=A0A542E1A8_9MICO|nr:ABC transporter permease [Lapillicoccus jejuensis]TQJ09126.1 ABC-2 type transport system permease protein [Lapillicoccus jejuensis]